MRFIEFLVEGIVSRTSQHDKRFEGAINIIAKALADNYDVDPKTNIMSPRSGEMIDRAHEWLTHYVNAQMEARADAAMKVDDEDMEDYQWERDKSIKTKSQLAKEFGIKPQYIDTFFRAFLFFAQEYVRRTGSVHVQFGDANVGEETTDAANEWYEEKIHELEKKYEAYRSN